VIYSVELEIPPQTTKLLAVEATLEANVGTVSQVWVRWRWGSGNLCGVSISHEGVQIWPIILSILLLELTMLTTAFLTQFGLLLTCKLLLSLLMSLVLCRC